MQISQGFTCMKLIETDRGMVAIWVENDGEQRVTAPWVRGFSLGDAVGSDPRQHVKGLERYNV